MRNTRIVFQGVFLVVLILAAAAGFVSAQSADTPRYTEMTDGERRKFIETESNKMLNYFRRVPGDEINAAAVDRIKIYLDGYVRRTAEKPARPAKCSFGDSLKTVLRRGGTHAPAIRAAFDDKNIPSQVGIYIAMVETEFCPCVQSQTGALGMFQFNKTTGKLYGLKTLDNASPANPDERCKPELAARAAANYIDQLFNQYFGRNGYGFPLSVMSYSAGEGNTKLLVRNAKTDLGKDDISFWMLSDYVGKKWNRQIAEEPDDENADDDNTDDENALKKRTRASVKLFLMETEKYVHKFFAASIVGENPKSFGVEMQPLSQTK